MNKRESWVIDHIVIPGETSEEHVWRELDDLLATEYQHPSGEVLPIRKVAIDSGFNTNHVYNYVGTKHSLRVIAIKGRDNLDVPVAQPKKIDITPHGKRLGHGTKVWHVGVDLIKSDFYSRLKLPVPTEKELAAHGYPPGFKDVKSFVAPKLLVTIRNTVKTAICGDLK